MGLTSKHEEEKEWIEEKVDFKNKMKNSIIQDSFSQTGWGVKEKVVYIDAVTSKNVQKEKRNLTKKLTVFEL